MRIKPDNLAARLEGLFGQDMAEALPDLEALVSETIALVEVHLPQLNTTAAKARLGWRHQPWEMGDGGLGIIRLRLWSESFVVA
jgi:hypothetical protein